jgi:hypothetical protein
LLPKNLEVGKCYLKKISRSGHECKILNLVTKEYKYDKPSYTSLQNSLENLLVVCQRERIFQLKMPRIASGLDKISWNKVLQCIKNVFANKNIEIKIYQLQ